MKNGLITWDHNEVPDDEIRARIEMIQKRMRVENVDALIIFGDVNEAGGVSYFSNFAPYWFSTAMILGQTGEGLMTTAMAQRTKPWIQSNSLTQDIRFQLNYGKGCSDVLKEIGLNHDRVGVVEFDLFPYTAYLDLKKEFPHVEFIDATEMVNEFRLIRSPVEISLIRKAAQIADESMEDVIKHGNFAKECELAAEIELQTRYRRCQDVFVHVASHANGNRWLHLPTEQPLKQEVVVEVMVQYRNYWADLGRTILPQTPEAALLRLKNLTEQTYSKAIEYLKPGTVVEDILQKIREQISTDAIRIFSSIGFGLYVESMRRAWINDESRGNFDTVLKQHMEIFFQLGLLDRSNSNKFLIQDTFIIGEKEANQCTKGPFGKILC
jgi:Xaa-Pro aminopeptidase